MTDDPLSKVKGRKNFEKQAILKVVALVIMLVALKLTSLLSNKISQAASPIKTY